MVTSKLESINNTSDKPKTKYNISNGSNTTGNVPDEQGSKITNDRKSGIIHIILAALCFALMSFFARMAGDLPSIQKAFFRNLIAFLFAAVMLLRSDEGFRTKKGNLPLLLLRSTCGLIGIVANFYAIDHLNISDANMLNKLSPFFAILFSIFILKEKAGKLEFFSVILAFAGALLVIKPSFDFSVIPALIGVLGGLGAGIAYTFVRLLSKRGERGKVIVCFFSGFSTVILLPFFIIGYRPMTIKQTLFLLLTGFAAMGGQLNITKAYSLAPAKEISIYDYSQIIFAALLGFVFLGQLPDVLSMIGYVIIIGAAFLKWYYSNHKTSLDS